MELRSHVRSDINSFYELKHSFDYCFVLRSWPIVFGYVPGLSLQCPLSGGFLRVAALETSECFQRFPRQIEWGCLVHQKCCLEDLIWHRSHSERFCTVLEHSMLFWICSNCALKLSSLVCRGIPFAWLHSDFPRTPNKLWERRRCSCLSFESV